MRILQIHPFLRSEQVAPMVGGAARTALDLTCYLQKKGHDVAVYPWPEWIWGEPVRFGIASGISVLVYAPMAIPERKRLWQNWKTVRRAAWSNTRKRSAWIDLCFLTGFQNALREFRPQIVHCHAAGSDIPEWFRLLNLRIPTLLTCHSPKQEADWRIFDRIIIHRGAKKKDRVPSGYPDTKIRILDIPDLKSLSCDRGKGTTPRTASVEQYGEENLRIYRELISMKQTQPS